MACGDEFALRQKNNIDFGNFQSVLDSALQSVKETEQQNVFGAIKPNWEDCWDQATNNSKSAQAVIQKEQIQSDEESLRNLSKQLLQNLRKNEERERTQLEALLLKVQIDREERAILKERPFVRMTKAVPEHVAVDICSKVIQPPEERQKTERELFFERLNKGEKRVLETVEPKENIEGDCYKKGKAAKARMPKPKQEDKKEATEADSSDKEELKQKQQAPEAKNAKAVAWEDKPKLTEQIAPQKEAKQKMQKRDEAQKLNAAAPSKQTELTGEAKAEKKQVDLKISGGLQGSVLSVQHVTQGASLRKSLNESQIQQIMKAINQKKRLVDAQPKVIQSRIQ